jgi:hypothetical protein
MKRLLQFATFLLITVAFIMPLLECFDRWDPPGLTNDTEFPVFFIVLFVVLVLLAVIAIARRFYDGQSQFTVAEIRYETPWLAFSTIKHIVLTAFIPPLRI